MECSAAEKDSPDIETSTRRPNTAAEFLPHMPYDLQPSVGRGSTGSAIYTLSGDMDFITISILTLDQWFPTLGPHMLD